MTNLKTLKLMSESYKPLPTAAELWELFSYNPLTGHLHWRKKGINKKLDGVAGSINQAHGYWQLDFTWEGHRYRTSTHRLGWVWVTGSDPVNLTIDHKDGNRLNNLFGNLRTATRSEQGHNRRPWKRKNSKSTLPTGVEYNNGRYAARITANKQRHYLGNFKTPEEASKAYQEAAHRLHGEFV